MNSIPPPTVEAPSPSPLVEVRESGPRLGDVHDYARRTAFLTEVDSQTWISRYTAAESLGDPGTVTSVARYLAWLRRMHAAWSRVPMPSLAQAEPVWRFASLPASALSITAWIEADLREASPAGSPRPQARAGNATTLTALISAQEDVDAAYVAGAAYVAVTMAQEVAVLGADVAHLSATAARTELPQRYLRHCLHLASVRGPLRRELATWADRAGPDAAERVVLAARMLTEQLAQALNGPSRPGW